MNSPQSAHRPSLRWTSTGPATEAVRARLADVLGCVFTDETAPRAGLCAAPDVQFVAIVDEGQVRLVAHFRPVGLPFTTRTSWLDDLVGKACALAGLPDPCGPHEVVTGTGHVS